MCDDWSHAPTELKLKLSIIICSKVSGNDGQVELSVNIIKHILYWRSDIYYISVRQGTITINNPLKVFPVD